MESMHGKELVAGAVYEFHRPDPGQRIEVEIIFMHGLQMGPGDLKTAYYDAWSSRDGKDVWPEKWLKEKYHNARVLSLAYDSCARKMREAGNMGPFSLSETLLQQMVLPGVDIGQNGCPVIFVCHSLGGLIAKEIVVRCHARKEVKEYQNLLLNVKAFFFFATPHQGSDLAHYGKLTKLFPFVSTSTLVEYLKPNASARAQTHSEFLSILRDVNKDLCKYYVVAEGQQTLIGKIVPTWIVRDTSARFPGHADFVMLKDADHKTVCKPKDRNDTGYLKLTSCIDQVIKEYKSSITVCLSLNPIGIEDKIAYMYEQLEMPEVSVVGLFGMGGAGKTTLSKLFYNLKSPAYVKSCYLENVASKGIEDLQKELLQGLCGEKLSQNERVEKHHIEMIKKCLKQERVLVVIDDVPTKDYLQELQVSQALETASTCKVVLTSRDRGILPRKHRTMSHEAETSSRVVIIPVEGMKDGKDSDMKLFSQYAYAAVDEEAKEDVIAKFQDKAKEVVKLCNGLPLSLEVIGTYLGDEYDKDDLDVWMDTWNEAYDRLQKAESIEGTRDDKLWGRLRISYDGLTTDEKMMFLDFACIFVNVRYIHRRTIERICGSRNGIEHLVNRHLLKLVTDISGDEKFVMHDQLGDMGRMIAGKAVTKDGLVYLWEADKIVELCESDKNNKSPTTVLGLYFEDGREPTECSRESWVQSSCDYSKLRLLYVEGCRTPLVDDCLSGRSTELRWLHLYFSRVTQTGIQHLGAFKGLRVLQIRGAEDMVEIPADIDKLVNLVEFELDLCHKLKSLPDTIGKLKKLKRLDVSYCCEFETIPKGVGELSELEHLSFVRCGKITTIECKRWSLKKLEWLELPFMPETGLPRCPQLKHLIMQDTRGLKEFPPSDDFFTIDMPKLVLAELVIPRHDSDFLLKNSEGSTVVIPDDSGLPDAISRRNPDGSIDMLEGRGITLYVSRNSDGSVTQFYD